MKDKTRQTLLAGLLLCAGFDIVRAADPIRVLVTTNGLSSLTYQGVEYCDSSGCGVLGFDEHPGQEAGNLWSPCVVDTNKNRTPFSPMPLAAMVQGTTVTKTYPWGALAATYTVTGADLYVTAILTNTSTMPIGWWKANLLQLNSRLVFDGKATMPYGYTPNMHWDYRWAMWGGGFDAYETWNFTDPHVYWWVDRAAPFDKLPVAVMFADLDPKWQTGVNHVKTDHGDAWPVVAASDGDPGGATSVAPGQSDSAHVVIRFRSKAPDDVPVVEKARLRVQGLEQQVSAAEAKLKTAREDMELGIALEPAVRAAEQALTPLAADLAKAQAEQQTAGVGAMPSAIEVCADGYEAFGRAYPRTVRWTDRRPIGTFFVAESAKGWATNPNGWFNDPKVDVTTDVGREIFAKRMLERVDVSIGVLKDVGAQGVLWWDVDGARNPHPITYIGDPRVLDPAHPQHDKYAPELDTPVTYDGRRMPVVDACFRKWKDAGFTVGVTIRPQTLVWKDGAQQVTDASALADNLCNKATYARERWGCTIFYVDSISEWFGNWWMEKTIRKYPDVLLMPEWARTRSYRHSSQFSYTRFTGFYRGVPPEMQACWPDAFCCMGNFDYEKNYDDALYAVRRGNVQMFNCWYRGSEAAKLKQIYQLTGIKHTPGAEDQAVTTPPDQPVSIKLAATDEDGDAVTYSLLGPPAHGTLTQFDAKVGTVLYSPAKGYSGADVFTFKATDATGLNSNRGTVRINVK